MKDIIRFLSVLLLMVMLIRCAPMSPYTYQGAGAGALVGGVAGALLDRHNPWRGGIIGGALGLVAGATLTEISARAGREAALNNQPVYRGRKGSVSS